MDPGGHKCHLAKAVHLLDQICFFIFAPVLRSLIEPIPNIRILAAWREGAKIAGINTS